MTRQKRHSDPIRLANQAHQANIVISAVSLAFGLTELDFKKPKTQSTQLRFARQVAMYLVHVVYELNHTHIANIFHKDRSTVSHACKVVEDSRDDEVFDRKLISLENFLRQAPKPVLYQEAMA